MQFAFRDTFASQVLVCIRRGCEQEISYLVSEQAVSFLWHGPVKGAQTGLYMSNRNQQFRADQGCNQSGVYVAIHEYQIGPVLQHHCLEPDQNICGLPRMASRTDFEVDVGSRNAKLFKENRRHIGIVVLACMD